MKKNKKKSICILIFLLVLLIIICVFTKAGSIKGVSDPKAEAQRIEAQIKKIVEQKSINFELNKAELTPESIETLKKVAEILNNNKHFNLKIGGHTDNSGDKEHNLQLSQQRVDRVKEELVKMGVEEYRITAIGYGESKPLVPNDTPENREKNRRVEFNIIGE